MVLGSFLCLQEACIQADLTVDPDLTGDREQGLEVSTSTSWVGGHLLPARGGMGAREAAPRGESPPPNSEQRPTPSHPLKIRKAPTDELCLWPDQSPFVKQTQ